MYFTWTIYPAASANHAYTTVGWYSYNQQEHPRQQMGGHPSTPLPEFRKIIHGHWQAAVFEAEFDELKKFYDAKGWKI